MKSMTVDIKGGCGIFSELDAHRVIDVNDVESDRRRAFPYTGFLPHDDLTVPHLKNTIFIKNYQNMLCVG